MNAYVDVSYLMKVNDVENIILPVIYNIIVFELIFTVFIIILSQNANYF